ncbi:MAG TPA: EAL domain-containing protein [Noviherbaspirillum sp.]|uniref:EAL domain-containing protein n=1 Tax=Noviherbaspirillum sp. TaxID=1926288 RepID=UPI002F92C27A
MDRPPIASLDRANRVLQMLSRINRAIVRAESPDALYREACRIAVESGMFRFAWIGLIDPVSGAVRLMTSCGRAGVLAEGPEDGIRQRLVSSGGLADIVRSNGAPCIFNDLHALPPGHDAEELLAAGFRSMAGLPLREGGRTSGIFVLYADGTGCFDEAVVALLDEVVDDIAFSVAHMHDEQRRLAAESKLYYLAFYDAQTGLPNRALLDERLPLLAAAGSLALFDIRLQRLDKAVQIHGRIATDEMLRIIAARLESLRSNDSFVAQLAQDEFVMAVPGMDDATVMATFAARLLRSLQAPVRIGESEAFLHPSVGAAAYPSQEADIVHLLRRARVAARRDNGEAGFRIYSSTLDHGLELRMQMEADLHRAIERDEFRLYYQPQLALDSGTVVGVEALLQWRHPRHGHVSPGEFVPVLEECGLMPAVGAWVLRSACAQARAWDCQGMPPMRIGVNVSALQFRLDCLVSTVVEALEASGLAPGRLELELTEGLILENAEQTIDAMHRLKALGVTLSLDDFGTGYSSLGYLGRYPVDRIKIDRSFIADMSAHAGSAALVRSILAMAGNLGLRAIAEGVETIEQCNYLRKLRCDEMQGFLFSRAVPPEEIVRLLASGRGLDPPPSASWARRSLLLVDPDPATLSMAQRVLERERWTLLVAGGPEDAQGLLALHDVGVVLAAQEFDDGDDSTFLERVREMYPETVRILLCGRPDFHRLAEAVNRAGPYRALLKPLDEMQLVKSVDDAFFLLARRSAPVPAGDGPKQAGRH